MCYQNSQNHKMLEPQSMCILRKFHRRKLIFLLIEKALSVARVLPFLGYCFYQVSGQLCISIDLLGLNLFAETYYSTHTVATGYTTIGKAQRRSSIISTG
jgi:hypothetical protein